MGQITSQSKKGKDPRVGTGKTPKGSGRNLAPMKIQGYQVCNYKRR